MSDVKIHFDGEAYALDDFKLRELAWLEEHIGSTLDDMKALSSMKAAMGIAYIIKRRDNPEFTLEDAGELRLAVLEAADDETPDPPTKRAAGAKRSPRRG